MSATIGGMNARALIGAMVALALGVIFAVQLVAPQIGSIFDTNTTGWDAGTTAIFLLLGLIIAVVLLVLFLRVGGLFTITALSLAFANVIVMANHATVDIVQLI